MNTKRILIVSPDNTQRENLRDILNSENRQIRSCPPGELDTGNLRGSFQPQIVLVDVPDGAETPSALIETMMAGLPLCHVIVLTFGEKDRALEQRFRKTLRFLKKPFTNEHLSDLVDHFSEIVDLKTEKMIAETSLIKRNRDLENINERLRQIVKSTRRLTSLNGKEDLGPVMLHEFAGAMNARGGSLFLHRGDELVLVYTLDRGHIPERLPLPLSAQSVLGIVLSRCEPLLIEDIRKENRPIPSGFSGYSDPSLLAFPMMERNGAIVGIITLHNKVNPPFTRQDKELGTILASYGSETLRATQAIEDLKRSEEKARTILEANPDPVMVYDNEKNVQYFNPAFSRVFGWSLTEWAGRTLDRFVPEKDRELDCLMGDMEKKGESYSGIETLRYSKTGRLIPVTISGASFTDSKGTILGSVRNIRDITDQKNLEEQLIQGQKMEAIGTLASGIAHDFNNILSAIFGNLELAMLDLPENTPSRRNIDNIQKAAKRARDLVSQILSFSRKTENPLGNGRRILPHLIIREAMVLLRASLPSTIEIREMISDKKGAIHADPTQFHQIIMNLCTNAHHAMKANGGVLTIGLERVRDPLGGENTKAPCFVKLTVEDTGCGMDEATLKRIFDPYFTTKPKDLGTGLGLSVVRKIVDDCKGEISVFSSPGTGTRFELLFPESDGMEAEIVETAPALGKGSGTILFVDDEADIASLGVTLLQRLGYRVESSTLPLEALQKIKSDPYAFDMVITDMTMPKMTGTRLASAIKTIRPDLPVILCTGFSQSELLDSQETGAVDAILKKPVNLRIFSETISGLLEKDRKKGPSPEETPSPPRSFIP